jgi:predicted ATPase
MVVELEDIQWADTSSLAFFEHLASIVEGPLLLLVAARPELDEIYPQWLRPGSDRTLIDLGPIDAEASVELAEHLLRHVGGIPPELPREIARRSGGTPYFVEEMVKHLSDRGVIVDDGDGLRYGGEMERLREMPPTVEGVLQARLDLLAPPILTACRVAAVVGRTFWDCTLSDLAADAEAPSAGELEPVLEGLVRREIVRPEPTSAFPPCAELTFVHGTSPTGAS